MLSNFALYKEKIIEQNLRNLFLYSSLGYALLSIIYLPSSEGLLFYKLLTYQLVRAYFFIKYSLTKWSGLTFLYNNHLPSGEKPFQQ